MSRVGRLVRGTGILTIAALGLSACGGTDFDQSAATKVIQSVDVNLDPAGAITEVASNAVYLDELSGKSNSSTDDYTIEEVVEDLPVRVSTQYTTDDGSGSDLKDLEGHTGRVEIAVTVENLTLNSSELTYDVAGESRQTSALVGTPLSVAGSVELEDTTASSVVVDVESDNTTNGVVSQTTDGDAVVQWGTVLAPPQSEATTTFRLVADVEDFSTPEFDLAVQAGFHTDMSFEGMLTSAFDTSASSEYAMQQKAIELVADINEVLTRAGTTITEIRQNLDHTTDTLGVDAAQQLRQNSDDMVTEMQRVGEQLAALESQVEGSMSGAETAMNSQLSQIVASMNGMMGNTEVTAPKLVTGQGCAAIVEDAESNGSLYSTFLILGAQLDGYAQANAECRDEVVSEIQRTLGPEIPDAEVCEEGDSITCTLFNAQISVQESLDELVKAGKANIQALINEKVTDGARGYSNDIGGKIEDIRKRLADVEDREDKWDAVDDAIEELEEIRKDFDKLYDYGSERITALETHTKSIKDQQSDIADELCRLIKRADSPEDLRRKGRKINDIHQELVGEPCVTEPEDETTAEPSDHPTDGSTPEPTDGPTDGSSEQPTTAPTDAVSPEPTESQTDDYATADGSDIQPISHVVQNEETDDSLNGQMQEHLETEQANWESLLEELGFDSEEEEFTAFEKALKNLKNSVKEARKGADKEAEAIDDVLDDITLLIGDPDKPQDGGLVHLHVKLDESLSALEGELISETNDEFDKFEKNTSEKLPENIDKQVRIVTDRLNNARDSVTESYNTTISGLATTSDAVVNDTASQLDEQKASLEEQQEATTEALNASTTNVLESIHQSTTSSTRDLEGASAQLGASLTNVILDLGDPDIQGSGILGSMSASSAMSDTADYQLALASQRAAGYANVRSEDIAEIMLRQAQFSASMEAAGTLPAFHLDVPSGARTQTIYAFHIGGDSK